MPQQPFLRRVWVWGDEFNTGNISNKYIKRCDSLWLCVCKASRMTIFVIRWREGKKKKTYSKLAVLTPTALRHDCIWIAVSWHTSGLSFISAHWCLSLVIEAA
jgi:hypothetical protein